MVNMKLPVVVCLALVIICVHFSEAADHPTKVRTLQKQCVDQGFAGVCSISTKNPNNKQRCSQQIQCAVKKGKDTFKQAGGRVPDGTKCGDNKVCIRKKCTATNQMPTYVGGNDALTCRKLVPRADKITPRPLEPLSP
ncbi:uncharacterized protein [Venturia canescens]|uniref:uncharacterized protein n=1 Tax=Venturia canescens TaxID=32260 RepID=UPI001C9C1F7A|nr:uncharacterized protein LOC122412034 [Venturia canescens]